MPNFRKGISFCIVDGKTIFLDVLADRYFALPDESDTAFQQALLRGAESSDICALPGIHDLIDHDDRSAFSATPAVCPPPQNDFEDWPSARPTAMSCLQSAFLQYWAARQLKLRPLSVALDKISSTSKRGDTDSSSLNKANRIAAAYRTSIKLISSENRCLRRSIGLQLHMKASGVPTRLVIGVKVRPFAAHAWVQLGHCVVNDRVENASQYAPILVI